MLPTIIHLPNRKKPYRVTWREGGNRKTRHFKTETEAKTFARQYHTETEMGSLAVSPSERMLLARIRETAARTGLSVETVAESGIPYASASKLNALSLAEAIAAYLADCRKRNLRQASIEHYEWKLNRFARGRDAVPVADITREAVADWVGSAYLTRDSRRSAVVPVRAFFRWCGRNGLVSASRWSDALSWPEPLSDEAHIGILRPSVARIILKRIAEPYRFAFALCCLTGIRPKGELSRMRWEHIDMRRRSIDIPGDVSKTRRARVLHDLPEIVWEWVKWAKPMAKDARILPARYRHYRKCIEGAMDGLGTYPHDGTRHSFASYGYHYLGVEKTVEMMGHVGGYGLFAKRYKASARAWTATLWFSMRPGGAGRNRTGV